ncbi:MAG: electron transfer flavoprotein subunit beta/FixA family protein [Zymomonas mobilis]|uniref:Electron transfer flavoprotein subunit beta n=1 Tax=Zymomonas mobilis TaxID=542 RepID=A0A542W2K0_ZYMMB|nr:electron transfer flavoprotein subunit beta/FixA family protein [Zymomonas mobilis]TQL17810.1 electron transfer flavoprotein beta subunit [Zymomonas mobilis]
MKVIVPVKRVIDYNLRPRVKTDGSGIDLSNLKMSLNPFDEIAVEEAVRMKEKGIVKEIILVSVGVAKAQDQLRTGMAIGADRSILIETDENVEPLHVAKLLKAVVDQEKPDLVIAGKQAIDDDSNQTGQMLAALLGWSQGCFASKLTVADNKIEVTREIDGGLETISLNLPAVVTSDLRLNEPRFVSLPNIIKARKKPIETKKPEDFGVDITPRLKTLKVEEPPVRQAGEKVESVEEFAAKLKEWGVVA